MRTAYTQRSRNRSGRPPSATPRPARIASVVPADAGAASGVGGVAVGLVVALLAVAICGPMGCAREDSRTDREVCTGNSEFPGKECPSADEYLQKYLSPPPDCNQDFQACRAENVRGPTLKSTVSITDGCCYTYTHIQKPDPIW